MAGRKSRPSKHTVPDMTVLEHGHTAIVFMVRRD
jgi:hypothetical protein